MYNILILSSAERDLDRLPIHEFPRIKIKINSLADQPRPIGSEKLTADDGYRIRIGDWRILYRISDKTKEVFVYRIRHRREVYR